MKLANLLLLLTLAQNAAAPPEPPARLQGTVVEFGSGRPLAGVTVRLRGTTHAASGLFQILGDTALDGTFAFRNVPPGVYTMEATYGGYIPNSYGEPTDKSPVASVEVKSGQILSGIQIALTPGAVIYGKLVDDRGEPVVGATVQALKTTFRGGRRGQTPVEVTTSNDLGEYRLFQLSAGEYYVSVVQALGKSPYALEAISFFFPGTIDLKEAQAINLRIGETLGGISFSALPTRTRRITGSVQGNAGEGAQVFLSPRNGAASMERTVDPATGGFAFDRIVPGSYLIIAKSRDLRAAIALDVRNADVLNARITLAPGIRIPVRVRIDGHGNGDDPDLEKIYFAVRREPQVPSLEDETYSPFANGSFTLDVLPGDYRLDIDRTKDFYVKSMMWGQVDVLNQGLHVTNPSDSRLEILVGTKFGSVEARTEGKSATVVLVPDPARRGQPTLFRSATPDSAGVVRFDNVPPGNYKLFAWQEQNGGPWLEPDYLRRYEDRGIPVRVEEEKKSGADRAIPVLGAI